MSARLRASALSEPAAERYVYPPDVAKVLAALLVDRQDLSLLPHPTAASPATIASSFWTAAWILRRIQERLPEEVPWILDAVRSVDLLLDEPGSDPDPGDGALTSAVCQRQLLRESDPSSPLASAADAVAALLQARKLIRQEHRFARRPARNRLVLGSIRRCLDQALDALLSVLSAMIPEQDVEERRRLLRSYLSERFALSSP